ncbi:DUF484 family protein [Methylicorpusculum oleiharenae]|uniref:sensor domain-containing diguanylate cyclase n=1 Tax=Methylicorpusculum oleiharenae TaxID=1338687 RepID=UPI00135825B4|nr:sensor domain-containing diguanylate cyclase [Methylicorpusculum oleiharenae]MCD2452163.1 DUF484 family protein [Methylicorpusculum oleiharenae]
MQEDLITNLSVLESHLDGVLGRVNQNSRSFKKLQDFERQLINASSLAEMILLVLHEGKIFFDIDVLTFSIIDTDGELAESLAEEGLESSNIKDLILLQDKELLNHTFSLAMRPFIGQFRPEKCDDFFSKVDEKPVCVAIIPLCRRGTVMGALNFGSYQSERFIDNMATDFLEHMVSVVSICLENNLNYETMRRTSYIDTLTRVNNRRFLEQRMSEELDRCQRSNEALSCLFLDIDHFKQVNDTYGHQAGDYVLKLVASTIKNLLRNNDVLARYGGEEFVALLSHIDDKTLKSIAERIRATIQGLTIVFDGQAISLTISIGASSCIPSESKLLTGPVLAAKLIESADSALYKAKNNGRNKVEVSECVSDSSEVNWKRA